MSSIDDDGTVSDMKTARSYSCEEADNMDDANTDSESDEKSCRLSTSLEWQSVKSPYDCFLYGWGNTVDGQLGLGGIEDQHIALPNQVVFNDSENIKHSKSARNR